MCVSCLGFCFGLGFYPSFNILVSTFLEVKAPLALCLHFQHLFWVGLKFLCSISSSSLSRSVMNCGLPFFLDTTTWSLLMVNDSDTFGKAPPPVPVKREVNLNWAKSNANLNLQPASFLFLLQTFWQTISLGNIESERFKKKLICWDTETVKKCNTHQESRRSWNKMIFAKMHLNAKGKLEYNSSTW